MYAQADIWGSEGFSKLETKVEKTRKKSYAGNAIPLRANNSEVVKNVLVGLSFRNLSVN